MPKGKFKAVFKTYSQSQAFLLPPSLDELIAQNHPVRTVNEVIDKIDTDSLLNKGYSDGSFTGFGLGIQTQGRLLGLAWKDKIGLEVGICFFWKQLDFNRYFQKFATAHPDYFVNGVQPWEKAYGMDGNTEDMPFFSGFNWGVYYNWPVGKFILQPHINVSFDNWYLDNSGYYTKSTYKQQGSNNSMESYISTVLTPNRGAYAAQLWLIYRAKNDGDFFIKHVKGEFAFRVVAGYIPYSYTDTIATKVYNQPIVQNVLKGNATQCYFNVGVVITSGRFLNR